MVKLALRPLPVGGCTCGRMVKLALRPFPVGGCPCGRMVKLAKALISKPDGIPVRVVAKFTY
jgi:hypothetical protein